MTTARGLSLSLPPMGSDNVSLSNALSEITFEHVKTAFNFLLSNDENSEEKLYELCSELNQKIQDCFENKPPKAKAPVIFISP